MTPAWRAFPWNADAAEGAPFSASFMPTGQRSGRFDLPDRPTDAFYLAESPDYAIGEQINDLRGQQARLQDLYHPSGHPFAIAPVDVPDAVRTNVVDLCDPTVVGERLVSPDEVAAAHRATTQAISRRLYDDGAAGLRWWSAHIGEWHTLVLFTERLSPGLRWHEPETVGLAHPALVDAARVLGIGLGSG